MIVYGQLVDDETRCVHYRGEKDIIALKCAKCLKFYPCYQCHNEAEDHNFEPCLASQFDEHTIFCGHCKQTLSIETYLSVDACPHCHHPLIQIVQSITNYISKNRRLF